MAEYIWLDGHKPTPHLRSKTKILDGVVYKLDDIPMWGFDGSSTEQAEGKSSDCVLKPVHYVLDPIRGDHHILVMCEVYHADGMPHPTNTRSRLREITERVRSYEPWFGIEQEYTLFENGKPAGWPDDGYPEPQGKYYCGVGKDRIAGRTLVEAHLLACLKAGVRIAGINAEVMLGQWEFQVGPLSPLQVGDELWIARWLLARLGEEYGLRVSFDPKPVRGDWNGAGAHTNFSTKAMRENGGMRAIDEACQKLAPRHDRHIAVYGVGNEERLTGLHETCHITQFRYGAFDRGASIRIPLYTVQNGHGYLEDRRPAANCDPYLVCGAILETVCSM